MNKACLLTLVGLAKENSSQFKKNVGHLTNMLGSLSTNIVRLSSDQNGEIAGILQHLSSNFIKFCKRKLKHEIVFQLIFHVCGEPVKNQTI